HTMDLTGLSAATNSSLYVLVVEPSRTQAGILRRYLHSQEIRQIAGVNSGQEALEVEQGDCPDAVITALHLPDMTGVQLARQIRAARPDGTPGLVLLHSTSDHGEIDQFQECGQAVTLQKPFTPEKLVAALSTATGKLLNMLPASPEQMGLSLVQPAVLGPLPPAAAASR